jgi:hypothetical protein
MMLRRKTWVTCGAMLLLLAVWAVDARNDALDVGTGNKAENPVGTWKLRCVSPDGKQRECVVTVFTEGAALKGDYTADGLTRPAKSVKFEDGVLSVEVDGEFAGQSYGLAYKGTPRGDALHGQVRWSFGWASGSVAFEGERIEQQIASVR